MSAKKPDNLGVKGAQLWDGIADAYGLRPDEARTLEDACREADLVERLEAELDGADLMVKGSMGQVVASPLVSELRQHRSTLNGLLKSLKLPDANPEAAAGARSAAARRAADARWARRGA